MTPLEQYLEFCDQLRRLRAVNDKETDVEFIILDIMDMLWPKMSEEDRQTAREQAWRAWPDKYEEKMKNERPPSV